jgi:hypothetical protein
MAKPKRPRDPNQIAKFVVDVATGDRELSADELPSARKEAGRKGGLKGGKSRMEALSEEERVRLAHFAATKRWHKKEGAPKQTGAPGQRSVKGKS